MTSLSFPDLNVWLAFASVEHVHGVAAKRWWEQVSGKIAFTRSTQMGLLRLTTNASAMNGNPLTLAEAWQLYDRFFGDDRVMFLPEPSGVEAKFRQATSYKAVSPKVWADAWLLAVAEAAGGVLVTFDKALSGRGAHCLLDER
jgi:toxin-antitoxin system PIN domain toxin